MRICTTDDRGSEGVKPDSRILPRRMRSTSSTRPSSTTLSLGQSFSYALQVWLACRMDGQATHSEIVLGLHCGIQFFPRHRIMHTPDQLILGCVRGIHSFCKLILWTHFRTWQGASGWTQNPIGDEQGVEIILQGYPNAMTDEVVGKGFDDDAISTPLKGLDKRLLMRISQRMAGWRPGTP